MGCGRGSDNIDRDRETLGQILRRGTAALQVAHHPSKNLRGIRPCDEVVADAITTGYTSPAAAAKEEEEAGDTVSTATTSRRRRLDTTAAAGFPLDVIMASTRSIEGAEGIGGMAGSILRRQSDALYYANETADGIIGIMRGGPNPRTISNAVCDDDGSANNGSESASLPKLTAMVCKYVGGYNFSLLCIILRQCVCSLSYFLLQSRIWPVLGPRYLFNRGPSRPR